MVWIALPRGAGTPQLDHPPLSVHRFAPDAFEAGVEVHELDGVEVKISGLRLHNLALYDWLYLGIAFSATVGVFLTINQLILTKLHPASGTGYPYLIMALSLLALGSSAYEWARRLRASQQPQQHKS